MSRSHLSPDRPHGGNSWADNRFISLLLPPSTRHQTPVVKKSLNPTYPADGATFDYPIYLSLAGVVGARGLEAVVWDKVSSAPSGDVSS